jgi:hypothetical protein
VKLRISGGYTASVTAEVVDRRGTDLTGATFHIGLFDPALEEGDIPAAGDAAWKTPTGVADGQGGSLVGGRASVSLAVSNSTGYTIPGRYRVWAKAQIGPLLLVAPCMDETVHLV